MDTSHLVWSLLQKVAGIWYRSAGECVPPRPIVNQRLIRFPKFQVSEDGHGVKKRIDHEYQAIPGFNWRIHTSVHSWAYRNEEGWSGSQQKVRVRLFYFQVRQDEKASTWSVEMPMSVVERGHTANNLEWLKKGYCQRGVASQEWPASIQFWLDPRSKVLG